MKKIILTSILGISMMMAPVKKSEAVVGLFTGGATLVVGAAITGLGATTMGIGALAGGWVPMGIGFWSGILGLVVLDGDTHVEFKELDQETAIKRDFFKDLKNLKTWNFSHSRFTDVPGDLFADLQGLTSIEFDSNVPEDIKTLPAELFKGLTKLKNLDLDEIGLEHIQTELFADLKGLTSLDLKSNNIYSIESGAFKNIHAYVQMVGNPITNWSQYR
jgi:Leucine-rich repeat (LRR) protein